MGTQRLRSQFPVPGSVKGFPTYLREAGYYCTNNVKTDYNTSAEPRIIAGSRGTSAAPRRTGATASRASRSSRCST